MILLAGIPLDAYIGIWGGRGVGGCGYDPSIFKFRFRKIVKLNFWVGDSFRDDFFCEGVATLPTKIINLP